jgi:glucose/mannose-6-phosphate isomerase
VTVGQAAPWIGLDSENMLSAVAGTGDQVAAAVEAFVPIAMPPHHGASALTSVVVVGMGTSALAGGVLKAFAAPRCGVPVTVVSSASVPSFVGPGTVVFALSFSGTTEETLTATSASLSSGASVVAVTGSGPLADLAAAAGAPVIALAPGVPPVLQSRAALGATVAPMLLACEQLGLLRDVRADLAATTAQLCLRSAELSSGGGISARVAQLIGRTIPLIHGASGLSAVAARRWKTQINENAKAPAFSGVQPEVCHNEVCGFGQQGDVTRQILTLVNLRTGAEDERLAAGFDLFSELTSEALARIVDVEAGGHGDLARFFDLVMIGDFVSLHLAAREGIDPGPVPATDELERRVAAGV